MSRFWRVSRPLFLAGAAVGALLSPLAAWAFQEAPELAEKVAAGALPPVDERLPVNPEVITPLESVGKYGGTMRRVLGGSSDHNSFLRIVGPQGLTRWKPDFSGVVPNSPSSCAKA